MILSNMHSHTKYCDGKNSAFDMADAAFKKGFVSFGFSGHSPLPYENDYAMTKDSFKQYIASVNAVKEVFSEKLDILLGLEWDYDTPTVDFDFDYIIGSLHQLHFDNKVFYIDISESGFEELLLNYTSADALLEDYYKKLVLSATRPGVDIVGHFDLITKFNEEKKYFDHDGKFYKDLCLSAAGEIIKNNADIIFEMNSGAISRGYRTVPYMQDFIVKYLAEKRANIMLNSDTHSVDSIDFGYTQMAKILKENGINKTVIFKKGKVKDYIEI